MPVSDHELAQAVALIAHDLAATLDWDPQRAATFAEETIGLGVNAHGWDVAWAAMPSSSPRMCSSNCTTPSSTRPGRPARCTHSIPSGSTATTTVPSGAAHPGGNRHRPIRLADQQHLSQPSNQVCPGLRSGVMIRQA